MFNILSCTFKIISYNFKIINCTFKILNEQKMLGNIVSMPRKKDWA
jgi:spore coat protein CotF